MLRCPPSKSWPDPQQGKKLGTFAKLPKVVKKMGWAPLKYSILMLFNLRNDNREDDDLNKISSIELNPHGRRTR